MNSNPETGRYRESTISGIVVPLVAVTTLISGAFFNLPGVVLVSLFVLLLRMASSWLARWNLDALEVDHRLPRLVIEKEDFILGLSAVNNKTWMDSFRLELCHELMVKVKQPPCHIAIIGSRDNESRSITTRTLRRGIYDQFVCTLSSRFPFGFIYSEKEFVLKGRLVVAPQPVQPPDVLHLLSAGSLDSGNHDNFSSHFAGEFKSMREYRHGDHAKCISWPRSIQLNQLIVRETEDYSPTQATIIYHNYQPPRTVVKKHNFEKSLQQLSGLCRYFREHSITFDFIASFNNWTVLPVMLDSSSIAGMMESLAAATFRPSNDMDNVITAIINATARSSAVVVVSTTPVEYWAGMLPQGHAPILCMDNNEVLNPDGARRVSR